ncbi:MAG TPA: IPT/TIG domain-containing protein [Bryobacteraceae bacterium]|nr:IPT/TIG domain-containing protein [Bryobacteraceae bacterium]
MRTNGLRGLGALVLLLAPSLFGATYTYTKITDNSPGGAFSLVRFSTFLINANGTVVFSATGNANGIYTGSGNAITTVVADDTTHFGLSSFNDSGTVVYAKGESIYTVAPGGTPFLAGSGSLILFPAINNAGTVAFGGLDTSILARTASGDVQTLVSNTDLPRSDALAAPNLGGVSINSSGTVAFYALSVATGAPCNCATYIIQGTGPATVVAAFQEGNEAPQINDSGAVAFAGTYQNVKGVFVASGGQVGAVVDLGTQVVSLGTSVSLNNKGEVAYVAKFGISPFVQGVFTGPDQVADKVIGTGDPLFGSVVSDIFYPPSSGRFLNDKGQVVFSYRLSNGLSGIAVATPVASTTPPPTLAANGIVNGASFSSAAPAAPGAIVSLFGTNFISQLTVPNGDPLPTSLQGVSVTFNGTKAPLFFVAPGQINAQVPFEVTGATASVQVSTPAGISNAETINLAAASPAIFTANQSGVGQGVVVFGNTATIAGPIKSGTDWHPAKTGDTLTIYVNGLGAVSPAVNDGWNSCAQSICAPDLSNLTLRNTTVRPVVKIGGVTVPDSLIQYSGLAPQFAGLYQINLTIPDGITPSNQVPVSIQMGNTTSPPDISIAMQ